MSLQGLPRCFFSLTCISIASDGSIFVIDDDDGDRAIDRRTRTLSEPSEFTGLSAQWLFIELSVREEFMYRGVLYTVEGIDSRRLSRVRREFFLRTIARGKERASATRLRDGNRRFRNSRILISSQDFCGEASTRVLPKVPRSQSPKAQRRIGNSHHPLRFAPLRVLLFRQRVKFPPPGPGELAADRQLGHPSRGDEPSPRD